MHETSVPQGAVPENGTQRTASNPRRWLILATVAIAQLMIVLDLTIVNVALPSAQRSLHFATVDRQWVVTAYALAFGSLLLLGGRLADLLGRKVTFMTGLAGFAAASAVGGASVNFAMLVTARACQGAFAAVMAPSALSILTNTFQDPKDRGKAFAVFGAIAGAGASVGLLLGGALTEYLSWRWTPVREPVLRRGRAGRRGRAAEAGASAGVASGWTCPAPPWSAGRCSAWSTGSPTPPRTAGIRHRLTDSFAAGVVTMATFAAWQARAKAPLLPPGVVLDRNRAGAYLGMLFASAGMFGIFLIATFYLQTTLGYSPVSPASRSCRWWPR